MPKPYPDDMPIYIPKLASLGRPFGHEFDPEVFAFDGYFSNSGRVLPSAPLPEVLGHVIRPEIVLQSVDLTSPPFDDIGSEVPDVPPYPDTSSIERLLAAYTTFVLDKHGGIFRPHLKNVTTYGRAVVFTANQFMSKPGDLPERETA